MALEHGLYTKVVMILRRELDDIKEKDRIENLIFKDNQQEQNIVLILIMSG